MSEWLNNLLKPPEQDNWKWQRFVTRAQTLFYARLAFLGVGLGILVIPQWAQMFGAHGNYAFIWYFAIIIYSVLCYLNIKRGALGKGITFFTLCLDLVVLVYISVYSGGLRSPIFPTQLVYTIFFALLFPNPLAILPPLLTLPVVAKIDTEIPGRILEIKDIFLLVWCSAVNFIVVYVIVYLNEQEEIQNNEIISLQNKVRHIAIMKERERLSREIHDGVGASLSTLIIQSQYLYNLAREPELKHEIGELKEVAEESIDELRRSISMMHEDFELVSAIEDYCFTFGERSGMEVKFRAIGHIPCIESGMQLTVFRVLQEALTNVRKHANTSSVEVELVYLDGNLKLIVKDNGCGFDYKQDEQGIKGHYGLANMNERARHYKGRVKISSAHNKGCSIIFEIPISQTLEEQKEI